MGARRESSYEVVVIMSRSCVVVVGFTLVVRNALRTAAPEASVLWIDEPDVIAKRDVAAKLHDDGAEGQLLAWEYLREQAAERFLAANPDLRVSAVMPGVEYAVPFAARLAELLGLPGAGTAAALVLRDKTAQREITAAAGVPNPRSIPVRSAAEAAQAMREIGGPVVVKPANRQASVGTELVRDLADLDDAWGRCADQDEGVMVPDRPFAVHMLVEQLVQGQEYSVELVVRHGRVLLANLTEKHLFGGARPIEQGHLLPAAVPDAVRDELFELTGRVVASVGFDSGIVHCEWIVAADGPFLVECAGRMPGDGIADLISLAWGTDLYAAVLEVLSGTEPELPPAPSRWAAVWFGMGDAGTVTAVEGVEQARSLPGVEHVTVTVAVGDVVLGARSSWSRSVCAGATGDSPAAALGRAQAAVAAVRLVTDRRVPVLV